MKSEEAAKDLITVIQAARLIGVSRQAIHAAIKSGALPAVSVPSVTYKVSAKAAENLPVNRKRQLAAKNARKLTIDSNT